MIQRTGNAAVPEWFKNIDTVSFWQSQLRGSKFKKKTSMQLMLE